ncbi:MAG: hypothetical protein ACRDZ8_16520 [Acidimicrobiales bacterium]
MSTSYRQAVGRKVISRATANQLGTLSHLLLTADCRHVAAVIIGKGKKAKFVDWPALTGFGADAIMVNDDAALRPPTDSREEAAAAGKLDLLGRRALSETGNEQGTIDDVSFDPGDGAVAALDIAGHQVPADAVMGSGSYAVVFSASQDPL